MGNWYVDWNNGSDSNPGTDSQPWQRINTATNHSSVKSGDTIFVKNGSYYEMVSISKSGITVQNYPGHYPEITGRADEEGVNTGLPDDLSFTDPVSGLQRSWSALVTINKSSNILYKGIDINNGLGRAFLIIGPCSNVTAQDFDVDNHRQINLYVQGSRGDTTDITFDGIVTSQAGMINPSRNRGEPGTGTFSNWPHGISIRGVNGCTIKNCIVFNNWGGAVIADSNQGGATNVTIEDCITYNNFVSGFYIHAVVNAVVQRCLAFATPNNIYNGVNNAYGSVGIWSRSAEQTWFNYRPGNENIKIVSNIAIRCGVGIWIAGSATMPLQKDVLVANNTVMNCSRGIRLTATNFQNGRCQNNISTYNDIDDISGDGPSRWTMGYNHADSSLGLWAGTGDKVGNPLLVDRTYTPFSNEPGLAQKAALTSGSPAKNAGTDLTSQFGVTPLPADKKDYWGTIWGTFDMGAHEDSGVYGPTATASADVTEGDEDLTVTFGANASGGTPPYTWLWDFDDGTASSSQNPSHIYYDAGVYEVKLTVTDSSSEGLTGIDTITIVVNTVAQTTIGPVETEIIEFDAGAGSFAVTKGVAPKAILFMGSSAIANDTIIGGSALSYGVWTPSKQVAIAVAAEHDKDVTETAEVSLNGVALAKMDASGVSTTSLSSFEMTVDTVTSSSVGLSWVGSMNAEKCTAVCFYGSGVNNATVLAEKLIVQATVSGEFNFIIGLTTMRRLDDPKGGVDFAGGFAHRGGDQMCAAYANDDDQLISSVAGSLRSDRVAYRAIWGDYIEISEWTPTQLIIDSSSSVEKYFTGLAMKLPDSLGVHIALENLPQESGNNDYVGAGFIPQLLLGFLSNQSEAGDIKSGTEAGVFGFLASDSSGTGRTHVISSKDLQTTSEEHTLTDSKLRSLDTDGASSITAVMSMLATGWRANASEYLSSKQQALICLIESTSTATSGPTASFQFTPAEPEAYEEIAFTSTSKGDDIYPISSQVWSWDDGTPDDVGATQTHSFASSGIYEVTLTVTDTNTQVDTLTRLVQVAAGSKVIDVEIDPGVPTPIPFTLTLDASGSTAPDGSEIDEDATYWTLIPSGYDSDAEAGRNGTIYTFKGITITTTIEEADTWDVRCVVYLEGEEDGSEIEFLEAVIGIPPLTGTVTNSHGVIATTGPYSASLLLSTSRPNPEEASIVWSYGDGGIDEVVGDTEKTHVYSAHNEQFHLGFNGSTSEIDCGSGSTIDDLHDEDMAFEAWILADSYGGGGSARIASKDKWEFYIDSSEGLVAEISCASQNAKSAATFVPDGEWHHVAFVWKDASDMYPSIWIDGIEVAITTQSRSGVVDSDAAASFYIGNQSVGGSSWDGKIGWCRLSNEALYYETFTPPHKGGPPQLISSTVEQWNLNGGTGSTAEAEVTSPTNDGTIVDGEWNNFTDPFIFDVSCEVTFPDETVGSFISEGLVTIVPISTAPATLLEMLTELTALQAHAEDILIHVGCVSGEWSQVVGNPKVYQIVLDRIWATGKYVVVFEDGEALEYQTSVANVNSNAGSYTYTFSTPNLTLYVHTSNTDNPGMNPSSYRFGLSDFEINVVENVIVGESIAFYLLSVEPTDAVSVGESSTVVIEGPLTGDASESVTVGDSVDVRTAAMTKEVSDGVTTGDSVNVSVV